MFSHRLKISLACAASAVLLAAPVVATSAAATDLQANVEVEAVGGFEIPYGGTLTYRVRVDEAEPGDGVLISVSGKGSPYAAPIEAHGGDRYAEFMLGTAHEDSSIDMPVGTYAVTFALEAANSGYEGSKETSLKVVKSSVRKLERPTGRYPTSTRKGKVNVLVEPKLGGAPGGRVRIFLKQADKSKKSQFVPVIFDSAQVTLPKLRKGTWRMKVRYTGDGNFAGKSAFFRFRVK